MRLDLSKFQPGAYAELREEAPYGLIKGLQPKMDADGQPIPITLDDSAVNFMRFMVKEWNVVNVDGDALPTPRNVTLSDLELVNMNVVVEIVQSADKILAKSVPDPNSSSVS